jgi:hypothetical protein
MTDKLAVWKCQCRSISMVEVKLRWPVRCAFACTSYCTDILNTRTRPLVRDLGKLDMHSSGPGSDGTRRVQM